MGPQPGQQASSSVPPEASPQPGAWAAPPEPAGPAPGIRYAGHGGRLVAYLVDLLLAGVIGVIVTIALSLIGVLFESFGFDGLAGVMLGVGLVAWLVITFGYFPWFWARLGQTPGMRLFRLRVVRDRDGGPISGGQAVLRDAGLTPAPEQLDPTSPPPCTELPWYAAPELMLDQATDFPRHTLRPARAHAGLGQLAQPGRGCLTRRDQFIRILIMQFVE